MDQLKAIFFDCWGTLFYNNNKPSAMVRFANRIGRNWRDYDYMKLYENHFQTDNFEDVEDKIMSFLDKLDVVVEPGMVEELKEIYMLNCINIKVFPETKAVLDKLKKEYTIALISNVSVQSFNALKKTFPEIIKMFDAMTLSFEEGCNKPVEKMFLCTLEKLKLKPEEAMMVGDHYKDDFLPSQALGLKAVCIDRRKRFPECPIRIFSLEELDRYIK